MLLAILVFLAISLSGPSFEATIRDAETVEALQRTGADRGSNQPSLTDHQITCLGVWISWEADLLYTICSE
jgi:hypothetical protein